MEEGVTCIFQALTHPIRRKIIVYMQEKRYVSFTELLKYVGISDHGLLGYHLKALGELIGYDIPCKSQTDSRRRYYLTEKGLLAAKLIKNLRLRLLNQ